MGSITLTVEGTTVGTVANGGGVVITKTVSEDDSARLLAAYAKTYGPWLDENGQPRVPSYEEILTAWFNGIVAGSVAHVQAVEKQDAAQAAANAVQPITVA